MSICEQNACTFNKEDTKYDVLILQLHREIKELSESTTAKLLMMDGKIAATCDYIKDNLSQTLRELLDTMISSGELDEIITETILHSIHELEVKTETFLNVKLYGAVGDGKTDDTNALQEAINEAKLENKIVFIPPGTYRTTRALRLYEHQKLIGSNRNTTTIKRTGTIKEMGETYAAALILAKSDDYVFEYTEGQEVRDISFTCDESVDYGIYAPTSCPYLNIDQVNVNQALCGIYLGKGSWLASISNVNIWKCKTGIKYRASGTSTTLRNIYVMSATDVAYDIEGLSYSEWANVCADWCTGTVYRFAFVSLTINGMGCECTEAKNAIYVNNARVAITSAYIFALKNESAKYIIGNGSELLIQNSNIGSNGESKAKFCDAGTAFNLALEHVELNDIEAESSTGAYYNITKFETGKASYFTSLHEKLAFLGAYNHSSDIPGHAGYDIPMAAIYSNIMGHPYYGHGLTGNREWHSVKKRGDIFINQAPGNGVAFYQQVTDSDYHMSKGVITDITGNVLTVSSMDIGDIAERCGTLITTKGKLFNEGKTQVNITAVDYENKTITVSDASKFKEGEHFYYRLNVTYMRDVEYGYVQRVLYGGKDTRPTDAKVGMCYFDNSLLRPIWWTGSRWVDANGVTR